MNLMITGGCGYVGSALTKALLEDGHKVTVVDVMWFGNYLTPHKNLKIIKEDIRNAEKISMNGIEAVFHLANIANDPCGDLDPKLSWEVNVLAGMRLIGQAIKARVKQFIFASSGSVYGVKDELEVTEELSLVPISEYNKTKMVAERVFLSYQDEIIVQCVRPATVCGFSPRMRLDLSVNMLTIQALANNKITVFGGDQTRPNIHIKDMIGVYLHFLKSGSKLKGIYNAGFENISILDIANLVKKHISSEVIVTASNDPRSYRLSSKKLLASGFLPKYKVEDAIEELIEQFKMGNLKNEDRWYNIKTMKQLKLG